MIRPLPPRESPATDEDEDEDDEQTAAIESRRWQPAYRPSRKELAVRVIRLETRVRELERECEVLHCRLRDLAAVTVGEIRDQEYAGD